MDKETIKSYENASKKVKKLCIEMYPQFEALDTGSKNYCIGVSGGWPIANGDFPNIDMSDAGLKKIALGAILIAKYGGKYPLPKIVKEGLNEIYHIK